MAATRTTPWLFTVNFTGEKAGEDHDLAIDSMVVGSNADYADQYLIGDLINLCVKYGKDAYDRLVTIGTITGYSKSDKHPHVKSYLEKGGRPAETYILFTPIISLNQEKSLETVVYFYLNGVSRGQGVGMETNIVDLFFSAVNGCDRHSIDKPTHGYCLNRWFQRDERIRAIGYDATFQVLCTVFAWANHWAQGWAECHDAMRNVITHATQMFEYNQCRDEWECDMYRIISECPERDTIYVWPTLS